MATLADLAGTGDDDSGVKSRTLSDSIAYRQYVMACAEQGKTPLSMEEWRKAGKPTG